MVRLKKGLAITAAVALAAFAVTAAYFTHWFGKFADDLYPFDSTDGEADPEREGDGVDGED